MAAAIPLIFLHTRYQPKLGIPLGGTTADIYLTDLPTIPIYHPNWFFAARGTVDGIKVYPDGLLRLKGVKPTS